MIKKFISVLVILTLVCSLFMVSFAVNILCSCGGTADVRCQSYAYTSSIGGTCQLNKTIVGCKVDNCYYTQAGYCMKCGKAMGGTHMHEIHSKCGAGTGCNY